MKANEIVKEQSSKEIEEDIKKLKIIYRSL
jgi:hypothetical protein